MYHILPLTYHETPGLLAGFAPDIWQIDNEPIYQYKKCCGKPSNWQPVGEIEPMGGSWYGWTHYASGAVCTVCGHPINAGFYSLSPHIPGIVQPVKPVQESLL